MRGAAAARASAAFTSRSIMRPCGPVPVMAARARPASFAIRRASGEAKMRGPRSPLRSIGAAVTAAVTAGAASGVFSLAGRGPLATDFASSPSPAIKPMTLLTGTSAVPAGTTIFASTPSSMASTSMVALSVSISASTSPGLILSPSFFSQRDRLPFSMVGERAGMRISIGMEKLTSSCGSTIEHRFGRRDNFFWMRKRELFKICRIRHRHILATNPHDRRVEIIKGVFHDFCHDLGADSALRPALLDGDTAAGFLDRLDDRFAVHRADRAQINDFGVDALVFQIFRRLQGMNHAYTEGNDGDILASAGDPCLADGDKKIIKLGYFEFVSIKDFVFEKDDRVRVADRALQKPLRIGRRKRHDDFEPRNVRIPRGIILAMLRGDPRRRAIGTPKHDRTAHLTAGHIARLGSGIDDLVHR